MTALLGLLTLTLALASLAAVTMCARPLVLFFVLGRRELAAEAYERSAGAAGLTAATAFCPGPGLWVLGVHLAAWGASGLLGLVLWWNSRRKGRRKALRLLGGKARAGLAAMARNMPRPSPRLVPQGARA